MSLFSRRQSETRAVLEADRLRIAERQSIPQPRIPNLRQGDRVWHPEGGDCVVQTVGWHGEPSPYYGDTTLRAYVYSAYWESGNHFMDWADVTILTPVSEGNENTPVFTEALP